MRTSHKEIANRFNGFSVGPVGVSWSPTELEIEKARRIVAFCEDRRILFAPHNWEMKEESVDSAVKIREFLTGELGKIDRKSELAKRVESIRKACRVFLDGLRAHEVSQGVHDYNMVNGPPREALDKLRKSSALALLWIVINYQLDVEEELASCFQYAVK